MMMLFRASLALMLSLPIAGQAMAQESTPAPALELWAGHQVVIGSRPLPVLGDLETRSESFLLAEVERAGDTIVLKQRACRFAFKKVLGVSVEMSPQTIARLPRSTLRFARSPDGSYRAGPWTVSWGEEDIDRDGHPGATVQVSSSMCSGTIYTASEVRTSARATLTAEDALQGTVDVLNRERVIDTSEWCLGAGSKGKLEKQQGWFRYVRVDPNTTCASLARGPWPVKAQVAGGSGGK
jgi:hypothetical protein